MTTTEQSNALAVREMSLAEIGRRIELNKQSGWGLERGTSPQLNLLALFCQKHGLLPGDDVTLYEGKPWITVDGRVKLMRRHKDEYRGHAQRPLSADEKVTWGWDPEDIVIETTIRTVTYGEMKAYGRVSKEERAGVQVQGVRHNPVARHHAVEMAMKRSLSRGERFTFGSESFVDEEEVEEAARVVIEERTDPARVAANAAKHAEIFDHAYDDLPDERHQVQPTPDAESVEMVKVKSDPRWKAWNDATAKAVANEVAFEEITLPIAAHALEAATQTLLDMVADRQQPAEQGAF